MTVASLGQVAARGCGDSGAWFLRGFLPSNFEPVHVLSLLSTNTPDDDGDNDERNLIDFSIMADVMSHHAPQVAFRNRPVNHAPSPLGFGFGLSAPPSTPAWSASSSHAPLSPWNIPQVNTQPPLVRAMKRRHENDEDEGRHDDAMERSPTPERPRRTIPKRARTTPASLSGNKDGKSSKDSKSSGDESDVDVGVLLGMHRSLRRSRLL